MPGLEEPMVWWLFVEDPGAANYFVPLVKGLKRQAVSYQLYAAGPAIELLKRHGIGSLEFDMDTLNGRPSLLVVGTSENLDSLTFTLIDWARHNSVPSVALVDSGINAAYRFRGRTTQPLYRAPDYLLVPDTWSADEFIKLGFDHNRVFVVGHPMQSQPSIEESRERVRTRVLPMVPDNCFVLVFVSEISAGLNPDQYLKSDEYTLHGRGRSQKRTEIVAEEVLDAVSGMVSTGALRPYLILRRHPKETEQDLATVAQEFDYISTKEDPIELAYAADLVVGMSSILLNEAHLLGTRTLAVVPREEESTWLPSVRTGAIPWVSTTSALQEALDRILNRSNTKPSTQHYNQVPAEPFSFDLIKTLLPLART